MTDSSRITARSQNTSAITLLALALAASFRVTWLLTQGPLRTATELITLALFGTCIAAAGAQWKFDDRHGLFGGKTVPIRARRARAGQYE